MFYRYTTRADGKYHPLGFATLTSPNQYILIEDGVITHYAMSRKEIAQAFDAIEDASEYIRELGVITDRQGRRLSITWHYLEGEDPDASFYRTWRGIEMKYEDYEDVIMPDYWLYRLRLVN